MPNRLAVVLAIALGACAPSDLTPRFAVYPQDVDLGPARVTQASAEVRWHTVAVQNETYFPLDLRQAEIVGDGATFLEWRIVGGDTQLQIPVRGRGLVEVRVVPATPTSQGTWSSSAFDAELRFEVGGTGAIDPQTQLPDLAAYQAVAVTVPLAFRLDCDGDGDGVDADVCSGGLDCRDDVAAIQPGAAELCDGIDNDCDELVDTVAGGTCGEP